jgi:hypothetical protein
MSDCIFKLRIKLTPSNHEFWPAGGWHIKGKGWACFYACCDKAIVRRAMVKPRQGGGWEFSVSEFTTHGVIAVALQPACETAAQPTQCIHAADLAACGHRYQEAAL